MVKSGSALSGVVEDTGFVGLEVVAAGLKSDGDGTTDESLLESGGGVSSNSGCGHNIDVGIILLGVLATALSSRVGVRSLIHDGALLEVFEAVILVSTVATVAEFDAINQLLFGEGIEISGLHSPAAFKSTGGRERPAGTAGTLVLDGGNDFLGSPVDGAGGG